MIGQSDAAERSEWALELTQCLPYRKLGRPRSPGREGNHSCSAYPASHGVEVRTRDEDAGDPGWTDDATADVKGDLPVSDISLVVGESQVWTIDRLGRCR